MYLPDVEVHEAHSLKEASSLLAHHAPNARLLAGGTDLLVDLKTGRLRSDHLVSIGRIESLRGVTRTDGQLRIGALTTITQLHRSEALGDCFGPIRDATGRMAAEQIRNMATVGGNLSSAVPCADLPPILMVMSASVVLWSPDDERTVSLDSFFIGPRRTVRRDDEVLTAVLVPDPPRGFGAAYARFALREGNAIAVAAVAASLRLDADDTVRAARIALGAVSPIPKLVPAAAGALVGKPLNDDNITAAATAAMEAAEPISDVRGSAEFRREIVGVLAGRALRLAARRVGKTRTA